MENQQQYCNKCSPCAFASRLSRQTLAWPVYTTLCMFPETSIPLHWKGSARMHMCAFASVPAHENLLRSVFPEIEHNKLWGSFMWQTIIGCKDPWRNLSLHLLPCPPKQCWCFLGNKMHLDIVYFCVSKVYVWEQGTFVPRKNMYLPFWTAHLSVFITQRLEELLKNTLQFTYLCKSTEKRVSDRFSA